MKKLLVLVAAVVGSAALAQPVTPSTGRVEITGTTAPAVSLKYESHSNTQLTQAGSSASNNDPAPIDNNLDFRINFGQVSAGNTGTLQRVGLVLALRSNVPYSVNAGITGSNAFVTPSDIGFAITGIANAGNGNNLVTGRGADTIATGFSSAPNTNGTVDAAGDVTYVSTLANIGAGPTPLLSGPRISQRGSFLSPNNAILVSTEFALLPQLFGYDAATPANNTFNYVVNLTMSSP